MDQEILARLRLSAAKFVTVYNQIMVERKRNDGCSVRIMMSKSGLRARDIGEAIGFIAGPYGVEDGWNLTGWFVENAGPAIPFNGNQVNMLKIEVRHA